MGQKLEMKPYLFKVSIMVMLSMMWSFSSFGVETQIPEGVNDYYWILNQFKEVNITLVMEDRHEESRVKILAQHAFDHFKRDESVLWKSERSKSIFAMKRLKSLIEDLYDEEDHSMSRTRMLLMKKWINGVGDQYFKWLG